MVSMRAPACFRLPYSYVSFCAFAQVTAEVGKLLGDEKVDAILCVAGGWAGGNAKSKCEFLSKLIILSALRPADWIAYRLGARSAVFLFVS